MSSWKKFQNLLIIGLASLVVSAGANAAVMKPQLDVQLAEGDTGINIAGDLFEIDASIVAMILDSGSIPFTAPYESFTLTSNAGIGSLQVGAGGSLLVAEFNNLVVTPDSVFPEYGFFEADLTYMDGSLSLVSGRIEGTYFDSSNPLINDNLIAKVGAIVPVPAAVWLFGSGLLGLIGVARRRSA